MSNLVIRSYRPEDLPGIVELYESTPPKAPFFLRNREYFDYFISFPSVRDDSIFIATGEKGIEGIAIIAIVQKGYTVGRIIELWASEVIVEDALVQKAIEYCCDNGIDAVEINSPTFLDTGNTFKSWVRTNPEGVLMVKLLSLVPLLQALFDTTTLKKIGAGKGFLFECEDEIVEVKIGENEVSVGEGDKSQQDLDNILIRVSSKSLLRIVFGLTNPYIAFLTRRINIQGAKNIFRVMRMLRAIRVGQPWTVAIVDRR